jgi:hypothetical protein
LAENCRRGRVYVPHRLGDNGACLLDCGDDLVDLLGSFDIDAEAEAAHPAHPRRRSGPAVRGELVPREQPEDDTTEPERTEVIGLDGHLPSEHGVEVAYPRKIADAERDDI